ncbi:MAG TPA: amidohydrolase family protein [Steroidobacteraceae bacterium]|jgi:5-methylthioadenosine/S-adenosylhomocysteine deaminase|nr:amidohydrolase family protein [Steroidobacteraceae bacterium]
MSLDGDPIALDLLLTGCQVVCFDQGNTIIENGALGILGNSIAWLGKASDRLPVARQILAAPDTIAMPGLIDCHVHTAQQFLHGKLQAIQRRGELRQPMWQRYLIPFESGLTPEDVYASALAAYAAMIRSGTTCFLEAGGPFADQMGRAADEIGIRGRIALSTMDAQEDLPANMRCSTAEALRRSEQLVLRWQHHPRVNAWLSLRQIMVNSDELRMGMRELSHALATPIHTHLAEGTHEVEYSIARWGVRPVEYLEQSQCLDHYIHAAHSVLLSPQEVDLYAQRDVSACHCALNNYRIGVPRVVEMMRRGIRLGFGTDGAATRASLDMFQVLHGTVLGQQAVAGTPYHFDLPVSHEQILTQALRGGAACARLGDCLGSLEIGKRADIVLVGTGDPDQFPVVDPLITLAESTVGRDVQTVIIDGRIVLRDGQLTTVDLAPMQAHLRSQYQRLMQRYDEAIR